jgi:hypothetical protein
MTTVAERPKTNKTNSQSVTVRSEEDGLALIETALVTLRNSTDLSEVKSIRDTADTLRHYAASARASLTLQNRAAELKLRAERRAGALLSMMRLRGGDRTPESDADRIKLKELGISYNQSARWQKEASVPEDVFNAFVEETIRTGNELSSASLLRIASHQAALNRKRNALNVLAADAEEASDEAIPARQCDTPQQAISEIRNHCKSLCDLISPFCHGHAAPSWEPCVCRMVQRLFREIRSSLTELERLVEPGEAE